MASTRDRVGRHVRIVLLDLDGTTVPKGSNEVGGNIRRAVRNLRERGIHVVLATARPVHNVFDVAKALGLTETVGWAITSNGGRSVRFTGQRLTPIRVERTHTFDPRDAFRVAMADSPDVLMAVEHPKPGHGWLVNRSFGNALTGRQTVVPEKELWAQSVVRAVVRAKGIAGLASDIARSGTVRGIEKRAVTATSDGPDHVDITAPRLSKWTEALALANLWGVDPSEIAAAGDGWSDRSMLLGAAWSCAPSTAPDEVQDAADVICGPVEDDGIATWLDTLELSQSPRLALPTRTTAGAR